MRAGIFGGTFDPPHLGHLILAAEAFAQLKLDRLLWLPTPLPPHKPGRPISPILQRMALVQAVVDPDPDFELSRVDVDRQPPYYAVDTLHHLRQQMPEAALVYLMGGDSLHDLLTWHQPREFVAACDELGVMRRPGSAVDLSFLESALPGISTKVRFVDTPLLDISSSDIRRRIATGEPYRYFVTREVWAMIRAQGLYQGETYPGESE